MDVADMFSDIDDHGFDDTSDERKLAVLNDVYHDVCSREPWPFLEILTTAPELTGNVVGPETDGPGIRAVLFLRERTQELQPMRLDDFMRIYGGRIDQTGKPYLYYFVGDELRIYPTPSSAPVLLLAYIRREEDLAVDSETEDILLPSEFHRNVLVNGALYKLYALEDDAELASGFQRYYEEGIQRMREALWKKQYQRAPIAIEGSYDGLYSDGYTGW